MKLFLKLKVWAVTYYKLFSVVSAVIVFASWLTENLLVNYLNSMKQDLKDLETAKSNAQRQFQIESKLLEVYQVSASARDYAQRVVYSNINDPGYVLSQITDRLERTGVTKQFAVSFIIFSNNYRENIETINPPDSLKISVENARKEIINISTELTELELIYKKRQKEISGLDDFFNPNTLTIDDLRRIQQFAEEYRHGVDRVAPKLTIAANSMFRSYEDLFSFARKRIAKVEKYHRVARFFQLALFVLGSIIAIYGTYLDALYSKK